MPDVDVEYTEPRRHLLRRAIVSSLVLAVLAGLVYGVAPFLSVSCRIPAPVHLFALFCFALLWAFPIASLFLTIKVRRKKIIDEPYRREVVRQFRTLVIGGGLFTGVVFGATSFPVSCGPM